MNLYELVASAQDGEALTNLGRQFGLSEAQSRDALRQLLPAFSTGLKRNTQSSADLGAFLDVLAGGRFEKAYEENAALEDNRVRRDGNDALGQIFGSKDVSRAVAARASEETGISSQILKAMLPYIAAIIMGALFKKGQNPIGDILGEILGGGQQQDRTRQPYDPADNPIGPLSDILKGGGNAETRAPAGGVPARGTDIFGQMFDADGDGSAMDDIFDAILGNRRSGR